MRRGFWLRSTSSIFCFEVSFKWNRGLISFSARTKAERARQVLGWNPTRGEFDFLEEIDEVMISMLNEEE
jgi:hypothetical protein